MTPYRMYHHLMTFNRDIFMRRAKAWCDECWMEWMMYLTGGGEIPAYTVPDFYDKRTGGFYDHLQCKW